MPKSNYSASSGNQLRLRADRRPSQKPSPRICFIAAIRWQVWAAMSEARKYQLQTRARRLPQSLEKALGVLVQAIVFALFPASFIAASEYIAISIDSVQSLQHKKLVSLGVKRMPRR